MIPEIVSNFLIFGIVVFLSLLINYKNSIKHWYLLLLFLLIGTVDDMLYSLTMTYPFVQIREPYIWVEFNMVLNWSQKIYGIVLALLIAFSLKRTLSFEDIGLKLKQNKNSVKFSLYFILLFFVITSSLSLLSKKTEFDIEALLFLSIMPGVAEELIYRGLLLGILNKIFKRNFKILGTYFGWGAILSSLVFGLIHGFQLSHDFQLNLDIMTVILTGTYGFIFALIRERSGSLVFPIIAHSSADFFSFFFRMI